jgi:hypothetical protein
LDKDSGLYTISTEQYKNLKSLFFEIDDSTFELTPNAQILPRVPPADRMYLAIGNLGPGFVPELGFICGMAFLERFYSVFDTAHNRIGLAATPFTHADTN